MNSAEPTPLQKCGNCRREIGDLEKQHTFRGHLVCSACYVRLGAEQTAALTGAGADDAVASGGSPALPEEGFDPDYGPSPDEITLAAAELAASKARSGRPDPSLEPVNWPKAIFWLLFWIAVILPSVAFIFILMIFMFRR